MTWNERGPAVCGSAEVERDLLGGGIEVSDTKPADLAGAHVFTLCIASRRTACPLCLQHGARLRQAGLRWGTRFAPSRIVCPARAQAAGRVDALAEFDACFAAGDFNHAAGYQVSRLVLGEVFIQSCGNQLLHAQAHLPLVLL